MSCTSPKISFRHPVVKQRLFFTGKTYYDNHEGVARYIPQPPAHLKGWDFLPTPCGGCLHCRLKNSREKAIQCVHESQTSENGSIFLTLTYNPEHLPANNTFNFDHPKSFMKKLRDHICKTTHCKQPHHTFYFRKTWKRRKKPKLIDGCTGRCYKIKSFGCAEYGENNGRAHYHLLIFNFKPADLKFWRNSKNPRMKCKLFRSETIEKLWTLGNSEIGNVTFSSAAYVARYVVKKNKNKQELEKELGRFHEQSICVSNGIGLQYLRENFRDIYGKDEIAYRTRKGDIRVMTPPKYYDRKAEQLCLADMKKIKLARSRKALDSIQERKTKARQKVLKQIKERQCLDLQRPL